MRASGRDRNSNQRIGCPGSLAAVRAAYDAVEEVFPQCERWVLEQYALASLLQHRGIAIAETTDVPRRNPLTFGAAAGRWASGKRHPPLVTWSSTMRRNTFFAFAVACVLSVACSRGYRSERTAGDTRVILAAQRYPLTLGPNPLMIQVSNRDGDPIERATVEVHYGMPPMPGMGTVSQSAELVEQGAGRYVFSADIHTRAGWTVDVLVRRPEGPESNLSFSLEAP